MKINEPCANSIQTDWLCTVHVFFSFIVTVISILDFEQVIPFDESQTEDVIHDV